MNKETDIVVNGSSLIKDVQKKFTDFFPYLKLEFLKHNSTAGANNNPNTLLTHQQMSGDPSLPVSNLVIDDSITVAELEKSFYDFFRRRVEVLRKSGNIWLQTNFTNNWTLRQQNEMGRAIS